MSRPPNKTHDGSDAVLVKNWSEILHIIDTFIEELCDSIFDDLKRRMLDKIVMASGRNTRLNGYDEKVYDYYKHLMDYYETVAELYEENQRTIVTPEIRIIMDGIYEVISLQLKQFMDSCDDFAENPVVREKKEILIDGIRFFTSSVDEQRAVFVGEHLWEIKLYGREKLLECFDRSGAIETANRIVNFVRANCHDTFYTSYYNAVMNCYDRLNDLDNRKSTSYYYSLLVKEHDILGSIIKFQVSALESETNKPQITASEEALVQNILTSLREGYQYYGREATEIIDGFRMAEQRAHNVSIEDSETFAASIRINAKNNQELMQNDFFEQYRELYQEKNELFKECLYECYERFLAGSQVVGKNAYLMQKSISEQTLMANEMTQAYQRLADFFCEFVTQNDSLSAEHYEIMKGITETIEIKIECINESTKSFSEECTEVIAMYTEQSKRRGEVSLDERETIANALFSGWKTMFYDSEEDWQIDEFGIGELIEEFGSEEPLNSVHQRNVKLLLQFNESIRQKITAFQRESILFEVSTYEEIMNYSVSRLAGSENDIVARYVKMANEVAGIIGTVLKKNNIEIIKPHPHEMFNGKEHEVIMAERNAEYKKGEIIKLMNSGYKRHDTVILRANVIAAK